MAVATATAHRGQVRSRCRAWTMSRGCWRLVVLLGLTWVAALLLGGAAHATAADAPRDTAGPVAADAPAALPLLGQVLANVQKTTAALPLVAGAGATEQRDGGEAPAAVESVAKAVSTVTAAVAGATDAAASATSALADAAPAELPILESLDAVAVVADTARATAEETSGDALLDVRLPSLTATLAPIVNGVADQVDTTAATAQETVEVLTVQLPLAHPLTGALASAVQAVDLTTDAISTTTYAVSDTLDTIVTAATETLAPILAAVTSPAGPIGIGIGIGGAGAGSSAAPAPQQNPDAATAGPVVTGQAASAAAPVSGGWQVDGRAALSGPVVPPPDSNDSTTVAVQPAADIVTILPVPVSGAGFTSGNGGTTPAPRLDQTLVRVESGPTVEFETAKPVEGPTGPLPGTPAADPAFSPD